jgi:hypothetical protein
LKAERKIPFFNSNIECRLLEFDLYPGSREGKRPAITVPMATENSG